MKCTFILTITFACLCSYINGQMVPAATPTPPFRGNGGTGVGGGTGVNGVGGNNGGTGGVPDYGYGTITAVPYPTYQPGSSDDNDDGNSVEDSTTVNPNGNGANGPNAQKAMSGGGQFALGFVAVLFVVGCAVLLVFLVRRKRAQAMKDSTPAPTSA